MSWDSRYFMGKVLDTKYNSADLSSIPRTHIVKGENQPLKFPLTSTCTCGTQIPTQTSEYIKKKREAMYWMASLMINFYDYKSETFCYLWDWNPGEVYSGLCLLIKKWQWGPTPMQSLGSYDCIYKGALLFYGNAKCKLLSEIHADTGNKFRSVWKYFCTITMALQLRPFPFWMQFYA